MTTEKTVVSTIHDLISKVISLLFNMLSSFVTPFFPRSKHLLISCLQLPSAVILEPKKIKSVTASNFFCSICHKVIGPDTIIFIFKCWVSSQLSHYLLSLLSRGSSVPLSFLLIAFLTILIPACDSFNPAFCMMYYAYKLNKQGDNIQPWHTPFPI